MVHVSGARRLSKEEHISSMGRTPVVCRGAALGRCRYAALQPLSTLCRPCWAQPTASVRLWCARLPRRLSTNRDTDFSALSVPCHWEGVQKRRESKKGTTPQPYAHAPAKSADCEGRYLVARATRTRSVQSCADDGMADPLPR